MESSSIEKDEDFNKDIKRILGSNGRCIIRASCHPKGVDNDNKDSLLLKQKEIDDIVNTHRAQGLVVADCHFPDKPIIGRVIDAIKEEDGSLSFDAVLFNDSPGVEEHLNNIKESIKKGNVSHGFSLGLTHSFKDDLINPITVEKRILKEVSLTDDPDLKTRIHCVFTGNSEEDEHFSALLNNNIINAEKLNPEIYKSVLTEISTEATSSNKSSKMDIDQGSSTPEYTEQDFLEFIKFKESMAASKKRKPETDPFVPETKVSPVPVSLPVQKEENKDSSAKKGKVLSEEEYDAYVRYQKAQKEDEERKKLAEKETKEKQTQEMLNNLKDVLEYVKFATNTEDEYQRMTSPLKGLEMPEDSNEYMEGFRTYEILSNAKAKHDSSVTSLQSEINKLNAERKKLAEENAKLQEEKTRNPIRGISALIETTATRNLSTLADTKTTHVPVDKNYRSTEQQITDVTRDLITTVMKSKRERFNESASRGTNVYRSPAPVVKPQDGVSFVHPSEQSAGKPTGWHQFEQKYKPALNIKQKMEEMTSNHYKSMGTKLPPPKRGAVLSSKQHADASYSFYELSDNVGTITRG